MLERLNEEIRRRTHVVRIFPNGESCLRLVRALAVETHENWLEQHRYLNMDDLRRPAAPGTSRCSCKSSPASMPRTRAARMFRCRTIARL
jgi:Transposase, Mutator family